VASRDSVSPFARASCRAAAGFGVVLPPTDDQLRARRAVGVRAGPLVGAVVALGDRSSSAAGSASNNRHQPSSSPRAATRPNPPVVPGMVAGVRLVTFIGWSAIDEYGLLG
jgi:hypothetical protein